jgi:two-component system NtrC family response regulator
LKEGIETAASEPFDVILLDVRMPDGNGLEALPEFQSTPSRPEVIILTGFGDPNGAEMAIRSGAWDYIEKGASIKEISLPLVRVLEYRKEKQAASDAAVNVMALNREGIIGNSPKMRACLDLVAQAARSDANVLISGETGTGKELFAHAICSNSSRCKGSFVVVDCAALPETLVESLLFGHEKGAFTGAEKAQEGLIRQANGGTLFLDEVGELPMSLQKAFLRVLQEHRFRPVGSRREVSSDFRLVAATNRNLEEMVQDNRFRGDLLFRLRSFVIDLPPLREHTEDIKELTRHHIDRLCGRYGLPLKGVSPEFMDALARYDWPGNVRELVHALERAVGAARYEPTLFPTHLPIGVRVQIARASVSGEGTPDAQSDPQRPHAERLPKIQDFRDDLLNQGEKRYLTDLMSLTEGDIKSACEISGLSQSRLYALLKRHDISRMK